MTLGEKIKEYRKTEGLSQEELAEKLNVSRQAITKWENDKGVPDIDNLIVLSRLMNISLDELVKGEKEENTSLVEKEAINHRNNNKKMFLFSAVGFSVAFVSWMIAFVLNCVNGNDIAAILNALNAVIISIPIGINWKKYFEQ